MLKSKTIALLLMLSSASSVSYANSTQVLLTANKTDKLGSVSALNQVKQLGDWYGRWSDDVINPSAPAEKLNNALSWGGGVKFEIKDSPVVKLLIHTAFANAGNSFSYRAYPLGATPPAFKLFQAETPGDYEVDVGSAFNIPATGVYVVEFFKNTESYNSTIAVNDIQVSSTDSVVPMEHAKLFEFVGDSITAGYNDLHGSAVACSNPVECEDGNLSYAAVLAREFAAGYSVIARSGIGVAPDGYQLFQKPMENFYQKVQYPVSENPDAVTSWGFATAKSPNIIFINLGTNDGSAGVNGIFSYESSDQAQADFKNDYTSLVKQIRTQNPNACIVCLSTLISANPWSIINSVIQSVVTDTKDNKMRFISIAGVLPDATDYVGDWTHPTVAGHEKLAQYIYQQLNDSENKAFTDACLAG